MKKIFFGITDLGLGGAERVLVDIANKLCNQYEITIFSLYSNGELEAQLNPNIKRKYIFNKKFSELSFLDKKVFSLKLLFAKRYLYNKYVKEKYDLQIAFLEGPITRLFAVKEPNVHKIAWVHNDISRVFGEGFKAKIKKIIEKKNYSSYEKLIFVSKDNLESFEKNIKNNIPKQIIYNYIDSKSVIKKAEEIIPLPFDKDAINIVSVSRLVEQKGISRWIDVHSKLKKEGSNQKVYIIGDGHLKESLRNQIKKQNVEDSFFILGKQENPYPYIKEADYFALLSLFEGYGMVLEEAKILGKNILITDTAAREAVNGYENARIFPNTEDGIYEGLKQINTKPEKINLIPYNNDDRIEQIKKIIEGN